MPEDSAVIEVYEQLTAALDAGDESSAMQILKDRFKELPETVQSEILGAMLEEAMTEQSRAVEAKFEVMREGVAAIKALEALKAELEKGAAST